MLQNQVRFLLTGKNFDPGKHFSNESGANGSAHIFEKDWLSGVKALSHVIACQNSKPHETRAGSRSALLCSVSLDRISNFEIAMPSLTGCLMFGTSSRVESRPLPLTVLTRRELVATAHGSDKARAGPLPLSVLTRREPAATALGSDKARAVCTAPGSDKAGRRSREPEQRSGLVTEATHSHAVSILTPPAKFIAENYQPSILLSFCSRTRRPGAGILIACLSLNLNFQGGLL